MFPRVSDLAATSSARVLTGLVLCAAFALTALGPATARTHLEPRYGGTLVVGLTGGEPDSLDPTVSRGSAISIYPAFCQRLYTLARNHGKVVPVPELAASLPALAKDKRSWSVELRRGVLFNDRTPLDAQAVVTTVERFMTHPSSSRRSEYDNVASVAAVGKYKVVFRLKAPDSAFASTTTFILSPTALAAGDASFAAKPVCAGPFMFDHRVVGDNVTLVKSPYWYARDSVYLDKIVYKPMTNAAAAAAALEAGDIHVLDQVGTTQMPGIQQDASLRLLTSPQLGWRGIIINVGNKNGVGNLPYTSVGTPFSQSPALRQAFEEALDRAALNKVVFGGLYQTTCTPIPPANTVWFDLVKVPCTPYDPRDAKRLVAKSGVSNPTVHLLTNNTSDFLRAAEFVQAQEKEVGITVLIDPTDSATATRRQLAGDFEITISGLEPGNIEPTGLTNQFFATTAARNYGGYSNLRADYVFANGLKASKLDARATNYRVALQILHDDRPAIFLWNTTTLAGVSQKVGGVQLTGNGGVNVNNAFLK